MSINATTSSPFQPTHANDQGEIEQNAAKNPINLAAAPTTSTQTSDKTLTDLYKVGKAAEKILEEKPQSLFSKMVQWFNNVILRKKEEVDAGEDAAFNNKSAYALPLERPALVDPKMMDEFMKATEKFTKVLSDQMDELRGETDLYTILMKAGLLHHRRIHTHRVNDHQAVLDAHKEADALKSLRKELNLNKIEIHKDQKFWSRVNMGFTTACALTALGGYLGAGAIISPFGIISAIVTLSSGGAQMVSARIKQTSEELTGESNNAEAELSALDIMTKNELKVLNATSEALLQLFKHLAETNQTHYRVNTMALSDR